MMYWNNWKKWLLELGHELKTCCSRVRHIPFTGFRRTDKGSNCFHFGHTAGDE